MNVIEQQIYSLGKAEQHLDRLRQTPQARARRLSETPIYKQVLPWLLLWPMLVLIAHQAPYFSGPAVTADMYQNGAAATNVRGSHLWLYLDIAAHLGFAAIGVRYILKRIQFALAITSLVILVGLSALWSAQPLITLQTGLEAGACTAFAFYLATRFSPQRFMELQIFSGTVAGVLSILFSVFLPKYGRFAGYNPAAWQGICDHKNTLGVCMAYLMLSMLFVKGYSRSQKILFVALMLFLICMSQSRGAWLDTILTLAFVAIIKALPRVVKKERLLFHLLISGSVLTLVMLAGMFHNEIFHLLGKNGSMTGRLPIYAETIKSIAKRPILGYGYGAFWKGANIESARIAYALDWMNIGYSESGVLDLALYVGLLGVGLMGIAILGSFWRGCKLLRRGQGHRDEIGWALSVLVLTGFINLEAGRFMTGDSIEWVLIVVACMYLNMLHHDWIKGRGMLYRNEKVLIRDSHAQEAMVPRFAGNSQVGAAICPAQESYF